MRVTKAVIPAAGLGTRFLPATKAQPKEMLPIVDKPTIQYVIEEAVASGIEDILIVTGRGKRAIEDHFDRSMELEATLARTGKDRALEAIRQISELAEIHYVRQKEPLGLGHAVLAARRHVGKEPFAVLLGDDVIQGTPPCLAQLLEVFQATGRPVLAVQRVPLSQVSRYGVILPGKAEGRVHEVLDLVEKPRPDEAPSALAVVGRYVLTPDVFTVLEGLGPGVQGEIQLTDALRLLAVQEPLRAVEFTGRRYDVGEPLGYLEASIEIALQRPDLGKEVAAVLDRILRAHVPPSSD